MYFHGSIPWANSPDWEFYDHVLDSRRSGGISHHTRGYDCIELSMHDTRECIHDNSNVQEGQFCDNHDRSGGAKTGGWKFEGDDDGISRGSCCTFSKEHGTFLWTASSENACGPGPTGKFDASKNSEENSALMCDKEEACVGYISAGHRQTCQLFTTDEVAFATSLDHSGQPLGGRDLGWNHLDERFYELDAGVNTPSGEDRSWSRSKYGGPGDGRGKYYSGLATKAGAVLNHLGAGDGTKRCSDGTVGCDEETDFWLLPDQTFPIFKVKRNFRYDPNISIGSLRSNLVKVDFDYVEHLACDEVLRLHIEGSHKDITDDEIKNCTTSSYYSKFANP